MSLTIHWNEGYPVNESTKGKDSFLRKNRSVDATGLRTNLTLEDKITQKRERARKQAMKLVGDAWNRDEVKSKSIREMRDMRSEKVKEIQDWNQKLSEIDEKKQFLKVEYGVGDESQEQRDLELLEKYQDNKNGISLDRFTKEELERLKELEKMGLTPYQKDVLAVNASKDYYLQEKNKCEQMIKVLSTSITDATIEQLKSQDMLKSQYAAEEIMDAAQEDILGMYLQEAKDTIDEEMEEKKEEVEEIKEKKQEQEEKAEKREEKKEEQEKIIEAEQELNRMTQAMTGEQVSTDHMETVNIRIQKLIQENHLINEDLKGIEIDVNF